MKTIKTSTKITLLLISMLTMMSNVAIITVLPYLGTIFKDVEDIALLSRLMITLPSLAIAFLAPFLGYFIYKFGKKRTVIVALISFVIFGTAGLYLPSIYDILFSRFLFGISIAILMIVSTSLIGDYFKKEHRHKFMGLQNAFVSIGGVIFIVGGGFLSDINWRYPFAIYGIGLIVLIFVIKYLVEYKIDNNQIDESEHLLKRRLWYIYLLAFIFMLIFYILPTQIPFLIINVFHASGSLTGEIISMAFVFNAVGALTFIKLKKRLKFSQIYILGIGIIAIGFVLIGFVKDVHLFFFTTPVLGFGGGILMANITTWMLSLAHHTKRIKSSSFLTSSLFFGQFCSPLVTHPFVKYFGVQHFFIASGITLGISASVALILTSLKKH